MRLPKYKAAYLIVTNDCNSWCSFCFRKKLYKNFDVLKGAIGSIEMTEEMAFKSMDFILDELPLDERFEIYFWGGEPLIKFDLIKKVMNSYPQFKYHISTNGVAIDQEMYDYFINHKMSAFTWSLGGAYEKYGGIREMIEKLPLAAKLIKDGQFSANFMVTNFDNMYDDFVYIYENLTRNITIDIATKRTHKEEDLEKYITHYIEILKYYRLDMDNSPYGFQIKSKQNANFVTTSTQWINTFGPQSLARPFKFCNTGLERCYIDPDGNIWQCDGFYLNQKNMLGNIKTGIEWAKLDQMWAFKDNPESVWVNCKGCELYGVCPRNMCFGLNMEFTGDMLKPAENYCQVNKALFRMICRYIETEKIQRSAQQEVAQGALQGEVDRV